MNGLKDGLITKFNEQQPWFDALRDRVLTKDALYFNEVPAARERLFTTFFDPEAGHRPAFAERRAALWLNDQLHFPNWTNAQINAFPLTTAHDWATAHHVRITAAYDNPTQEGGTPILDLHLPGLTREQLTVVPVADWQRDRAQYTFDAWLEHAHAAEAASPQNDNRVTIWPGGVSPLGPQHKDDFGGYGLSITHHATSGHAENHEATADIMVIQSGEATLVYGGEIVDATRTAPHEVRGPFIRNGTSVHVAPGDVIHFPAGMPHQWLVAPGQQLTYLVIHIDQPAASSAPIKSK
jgi:mannose-6-phosphate isomerase-like protein (cupin superfamily)